MKNALLALGILAAALAAGCSAASQDPAIQRARPTGALTSNVLREDYAGSASCAPCHADLYARFLKSPMHNMTRVADTASIRAPFDGSSFRFKGYAVTMETHGAGKFVRVASPDDRERLFRVTKVIGGRYREDFVGREVASVDDARETSSEAEPVLPVSWLIFANAWRYKGYSVMAKERPRIGDRGSPWKQTCIFCHNTPPLLSTLYDDLGATTKAYQGSVSDKLLPASRLWRFGVRDEAALRSALDAEVQRLGGARAKSGTVTASLDAAADATRDRFGQSELVEVGIGCEACHNGSRDHVRDPTVKPSFAITSPMFGVGAKPATKAAWINHTCARCHTVLFSRYAYTWEGGERHGAEPGGSSINSGEARDFLLGGCSNEMACTTCHDPHAEDDRDKLDAMGTPAGNATCTKCHDKYAPEAALTAHTHHRASGEGSACLSCHMPKKNMGLAYRLTRYHRIGSPTDEARVLRDRPLECALCHTEKSVESIVSSMESWWSKRFDRDALRMIYGPDLDARPLLVTLERGKAHEQATAASALGDRGRPEDVAAIAPILTNDYPLVRLFAREAMERLAKRKMNVDLDGDAASIRAGAEAWLRSK